MVSAPSSARACSGKLLERRGLAFHHVRVELRRPAHRLAGVVDDEVQPAARGDQVRAERLDAWRVPQIEAEDLQAIAPRLEVGFAGVACRGVAREPRGDDQVRARPQQLQSGLVADLDASAGQQRHASPQVGQLRPLRKVQVAARRTQPVVEVMDDGEVLLADVAVLRRQRGLRLDVGRREDIGRREHRLASERADARLTPHPIVTTRDRRFSLADDRLHHHAARAGIRVVDIGHGLAQTDAVVLAHQRQQPAIGGELLEGCGGLAQALGERAATGVFRGRDGGRRHSPW